MWPLDYFGTDFDGANYWGGVSGTPLLLTATLRAVPIAPPSPASPWSIDPERSQELPPSYGT